MSSTLLMLLFGLACSDPAPRSRPRPAQPPEPAVPVADACPLGSELPERPREPEPEHHAAIRRALAEALVPAEGRERAYLRVGELGITARRSVTRELVEARAAIAEMAGGDPDAVDDVAPRGSCWITARFRRQAALAMRRGEIPSEFPAPEIAEAAASRVDSWSTREAQAEIDRSMHEALRAALDDGEAPLTWLGMLVDIGDPEDGRSWIAVEPLPHLDACVPEREPLAPSEVDAILRRHAERCPTAETVSRVARDLGDGATGSPVSRADDLPEVLAPLFDAGVRTRDAWLEAGPSLLARGDAFRWRLDPSDASRVEICPRASDPMLQCSRTTARQFAAWLLLTADVQAAMRRGRHPAPVDWLRLRGRALDIDVELAGTAPFR